MTEPMKRLRIEGDSIERQVIESSSADGLSAEGRARLSAAVLGSAALLGAAHVGGGAGITAAAKGAIGVSIKWWMVLGLVCASGGGLYALYNDHVPAGDSGRAAGLEQPNSPRAEPAIAAPSVAPEVSAPAPSAPPTAAQGSATRPRDPPIRGVPSGVDRGVPATTTASASSTPSEELLRIDEARSALKRGDTAQAVRGLDDYDRAYPGGAFRQEADVLRVDAYLARGDREAAARAAAAFVKANPDSPYAVRLRTLTHPSP